MGYFCLQFEARLYLAMMMGAATLSVTPVEAKGSKAPPQARVLKKIVELGHIKAAPIPVTPGSVFDLENAVNAQFAAAILSTGHYTVKIRKQGTTATLLSQNNEISLAGFDDSPQDPSVCLPDVAPIKFNGQILGFELTSVTGIKFGYSPAGSSGPTGSLALRIAKASMSAVMDATDARDTLVLGSAQVTSKQTETKIDADVNFAQFMAGFEFYSKSPLAGVSMKALTLGANALKPETDKYPWEGMVIANDGINFVALNAGEDAGVKVGDQFEIRNVTHYWKGVPCQSEYIRAKVDRLPVAIVTIYDVQSTYSWARVSQKLLPESMVNVGAKALISKLMPAQ